MNREKYDEMYSASIADPEKFWSTQADRFVTWFKEWDTVYQGSFQEGSFSWFRGAQVNASFNCIDRHVLNGFGDRVAYFFEGNEGEQKTITYNTLLKEVSAFANMLKSRGVKKGDRVCIYMPMIPEVIYAMLGCTRIGAVHSVVFAGFSSESLRSRIVDASCGVVVTADIGKRGEKSIRLYERVEEILDVCPTVHTTIVIETDSTQSAVYTRENVCSYAQLRACVSEVCEPEWMDAEDPLFVLYTSGSTGAPKGVLHTTGGYLLYTAMTHHYNFDYTTEDVYWCTADVGWITGHSYVVYGPLMNCATSVLFEGVPTYPNAARYWEIVDRYCVSIFYAAPTAIRMLMAQGDALVQSTKRTSLRILGTVGEPINPEAWRWYHEVVGRGMCFITDTWWQTETGGHVLAPMPGVTVPKPGAAMMPFFGIQPVLLHEDGSVVEGVGEGVLVLKGSWPGQMRDIYGNHERFLETYLRPFPGYYYTGDGARRDADGDIWISGRVDDTLNVAGRLIGTAELESALVLHTSVVEAAVVAVSHPITGYAVCAFVVSVKDATYTHEHLSEELALLVKKEIGSFAQPKIIIAVARLPKTRSGKIVRRLLRALMEGKRSDFGDLSTLAEPDVIEEIIARLPVL